MEILNQLFIEREQAIHAHNDFVNAQNAAGIATRADCEKIAEMRGEINTMTRDINAAMSAPTTKPILINPQDVIAESPELYSCGGNSRSKTKNAPHGVQGAEYKRRFFEQMRAGFSGAQNYLRESETTRGGYLVPSEFHASIISELTSENILRTIGNVISTSSTHKIPVLETRPTANWVAEGARIEVSQPTFSQVTLDAHKLAVAVDISNELLTDAYYNLESFCTQEFGKALALAEEETFLTGDGVGKPAGLIPALAADSAMTISTSGNTITADDLINLMHAVPRAYRKGGAWLMNDTTLAAVRKLKDSTQNYLWQASLIDEQPEKLLGYPVYTSAFVPEVSSGKIAVIFGGWRYYTIAQRGELIIKPLYEMKALDDITTMLAIERVDAKVIDKRALRGLRIK